MDAPALAEVVGGIATIATIIGILAGIVQIMDYAQKGHVHRWRLAIVGAFLAGGVAVFLVGRVPPPPPLATSMATATATPQPPPTATSTLQSSPSGTLPPPPSPSAEIFTHLPGTSGAVALLPSGRQVEHNAHQQGPAGSIIKLWIAAVVFEQEAAGQLSLSDSYPIRDADQVPGTGILNQKQYVGRSFTYARIVDTMLIYSDNTAANIVITRLGGFQSVNNYARKNGYDRTLLQRDLGRPDPSRENLTSARDCATFLDNLLKKRVVGERASNMILDALARRRGVENQDEVYNRQNYFGRFLPRSLAYRHISGLIPDVRNDVGYYPTANGSPVIVAILLSNLVDEAAGEEAIGRAVEQIYRAVS